MARNSSHLEYDGFKDIDDKLKTMSLSDPKVRKKIQEATWEVLAQVRKAIAANARFRDSRHNSIAAIRRSVFRKVIGGSVSILDSKRKANRGSFKATGQNYRTALINSYSGRERGFILRFVNSGTEDRYGGEGRNKGLSREYIASRRGKPGFRGRIKARNFFSAPAHSSIQKAAEQLADIIENEVTKQFKNG